MEMASLSIFKYLTQKNALMHYGQKNASMIFMKLVLITTNCRSYSQKISLQTLQSKLQPECQKEFWGKLFGGTVPPNNTLFGGTVPPNNTLFGGTVPPNSTLFGGTPDSDKDYLISSINYLILTLRNQHSQFFLRSTFWSSYVGLLWEPSKRNVTKSENSPKGGGEDKRRKSESPQFKIQTILKREIGGIFKFFSNSWISHKTRIWLCFPPITRTTTIIRKTFIKILQKGVY